ncbi:MAG: ABC transporter ATP-binding protein [Oscillospiraceae bacterium]|nr:MAG: ABC transporter ATP-binding protein [Oscillospiraceae bacterium]
MKSAGKARNNGLYRHIRTSKEIIRNLLNDSVKYNDDNQCVLNNISFSFEMGKVYSLIGTNGAGKTTLLNLLCRLYDVTDGEILYNGVPIKQYNIDSYRALFSSVFQQTKTFALSIAENVALDKYRVGDHEQRKTIYAIFQRIGMGDFIDSLPDGIDTQMGKTFDENGVILSGGQMQKIAIARALFRDSEILLFDEPSSALDPIAEDEFFNVLRSVSGGKMVFYVSHRLSSAIFADEILFIRDHKIFAHGPHFELLRTCLEYYEYYNAQAKYYQTEEQNHE